MRTLLPALLLVLATWPARADVDEEPTLDAALEALGEGEFETAVSNLVPVAEKSDATAQYLLGLMLRCGYGVRAKDPAGARAWLEKAAAQNVIQAQFELGLIYFNGIGVERDRNHGIGLFRRAALSGESRAAFNMAATAYNGDGVDQSYVDAYAWAMLAKELGHRDAPALVERIEGKLDATTRETARRRWTDLSDVHRTAATGGVVSFQFDLASAETAAYEKGERAYLAHDYDRALRYFVPLVGNGHGNACFYFARMLQMGRGVTQDHPRAAVYYRASILGGSDAAIYNLGILYLRGEGMEHDPAKAVDLFEAAAWRGDAGAMAELADCLMRGTGRDRDDVMAYAWFELAAARGNDQAKKMLAVARRELAADVIRQGDYRAQRIDAGRKGGQIPTLPLWLIEGR